MADSENTKNSEPEIDIELRDASWAALLGWLWPGAGHIYQRRYSKGMLFMICILGIYFFGLALGGGRVVYASWKPNDRRWQYACQLGVGVPAFPAIIQSMKIKNGGKPFFILTERYPRHSANAYEPIPQAVLESMEDPDTLTDAFMAPPEGEIFLNENDVLGQWNEELGYKFQIGTLYTVIAGLLNLLAVYDAFAGPVIERSEEKSENDAKEEESDKS